MDEFVATMRRQRAQEMHRAALDEALEADLIVPDSAITEVYLANMLAVKTDEDAVAFARRIAAPIVAAELRRLVQRDVMVDDNAARTRDEMRRRAQHLDKD